jgi:hypothetical protein
MICPIIPCYKRKPIMLVTCLTATIGALLGACYNVAFISDANMPLFALNNRR